MSRPLDNVKVESVGDSVLDAPFTTIEVVNDIMSPSEASFELGNDGMYSDIEQFIAHGKQYKVWTNNKLRVTGRIEAQDIPADAGGGSTVRFNVRTKLADAAFESAPAGIRVKDTSIKDFVLRCYAPLGYAESDFVFDQYTARDLLTGKATGGKGKSINSDLEPIKIPDAKVQPPETIYDAVDRHLRRHGLLHWDSPDGKIVIGGINDTQPPIFKIRCNRDNRSNQNNVLALTRVRDWSEIPSHLTVHGIRTGKGTSRGRIGYQVVDQDLIDAGFHRPVKIISEGIRKSALAQRAAYREQSARSKNKDSFVCELDQWTYWDGYENTPWGTDCVVEVESGVHGGSLGNYYVHRVMLRRNTVDGDVTNLTMLKSGVWRL